MLNVFWAYFEEFVCIFGREGGTPPMQGRRERGSAGAFAPGPGPIGGPGEDWENYIDLYGFMIALFRIILIEADHSK